LQQIEKEWFWLVKKAVCGNKITVSGFRFGFGHRVSSSYASSQACETKKQLGGVKKRVKRKQDSRKTSLLMRMILEPASGTQLRNGSLGSGHFLRTYINIHFLLWISMFKHSSAFDEVNQVRVIFDTLDVFSTIHRKM
jgi:hypothetical protein